MATNPTAAKQFGIDVVDNKDIESLAVSNASLSEKVETLINLVEEMHIVGRDNHAIFVEMLHNAEVKLNKRIDDLKTDMFRLINARPGDNSSTTATVLDRINKYKVEEKAVLGNVKAAASTPSKHHNGHEKPLVYETIHVTPIPGFVIKTKKLLGNKEKAFINVFHHPRVELEPTNSKDHGEDKPYIVINEIASTTDKEGVTCLMYNIAVSSEFFRQPNNANPKLIDLTITSPQCVSKIIHKVNMKFNEFLDEANYVLPRLALGYKGDSVPIFALPVVKPPAPTPSPAAAAHRGSIPTIPEDASLPDTTVYVDGSAKVDHHTPSPPSVAAGGAAAAANPSPSAHDLAHFDSRASMGSIDDNSSVISDITHDTSAMMNPNASTHSLVGGGAAAAARRNSSITSQSGLAKKLSKPRMHRKSVFDTSGMGFNGGAIAGRNLLSAPMLEYVREECVDSGTADAIKAEAVSNPSILLGWQINIDPSDHRDEKCSGLYVITDTRKNLMSKSEFRISRFHEDDQWVKLKRDEGKSGYSFRAMRKVLFGLVDDDDTSVMMAN